MDRPEGALDPERLAVRRPWLPDALCSAGLDAGTVGSLSYVCVDEVLGSLVSLAVVPWPAADGHGRLRFDDSQGRGHVVVHRRELHDRLYAGWLRRDPRVGDVLAATVEPAVQSRLASGEDVLCDPGLRLADVLVGPVHDLGPAARRVAKLAFHGASAPPVPFSSVVANEQQGLVPRSATPAEARAVSRRPWTGPVVLQRPPEVTTGPSSAKEWGVPHTLLRDDPPEAFVEEVRARPEALVYFLLNVGDGDTQLVLLPPDSRTGHRRALVVDVATQSKLPALLDALEREHLLPDMATTPGAFPVVVGTHPHDDHIGGMAELLDRYGRHGAVRDYWEPGYYHTSAACVETMALLEETGICRTQPTSGTTRWAGSVKITVLAPGVGLRQRYDSYGVDINDSSVVLRLEFPAARVAEELHERGPRNRTYLRLDSPWALLLGGDAQTTSWSQVAVDFPQLHRQYDTALYQELSAARGRDDLAAQVVKVAHHASKHGVNLELMERVSPQVSLVSSVCGEGKYNFPHALATEAIREAAQASASGRVQRWSDPDLGIHYTGAHVDGGADDGAPLGTIALVVPPRRGAPLRMWRFGDEPGAAVDLARGRRLTRLRRPR